MKVTVIGANGSMGLQVSKDLMSGIIQNVSELVLVVRTEENFQYLQALKEDALLDLLKIKCRITKNKEDIANSDIIVFCAGMAVSTAIKKDVLLKNNRSDLFETNKAILEGYIDVLNNSCKKATLFLVTNPGSKLIQYIAPKLKCSMVGVGMISDTIRINSSFREKFGFIPENFFAIGEHSSIENLTYTYSQLPGKYRNKLVKEQNKYLDERDEKDVLNDLKKYHIDLLETVETESSFNLIKELPLKYYTYSRHRLVHFMSKTIMSTAMAVMEGIKAYSDENKIISVETVCTNYIDNRTSVLGVPVCFKNGKPIPQMLDYSPEEIEVLNICSKKYEIADSMEIQPSYSAVINLNCPRSITKPEIDLPPSFSQRVL